MSPCMVALIALGMIAPLSAQNFTGSSDQSDFRALAFPGTFELPAIERAQGKLSDERAVIAAQDPVTLEARENQPREVDSVVNLDMLRKPSAYRKIQVRSKGRPYEIDENGFQNGLARISAAYRESGKVEKSSDCQTVALSVEQQIKLDRSQVLEIVEREVGANSGCACEVVKSAITASEASIDEVVAIVETAILVSPESMRIVSQCAIATMPDAIASVQALLARLDPNAGDSGYSSKSAKSAKSGKEGDVAAISAPEFANPLDLPTGPPLPPPPYFPPHVTNVNP